MRIIISTITSYQIEKSFKNLNYFLNEISPNFNLLAFSRYHDIFIGNNQICLNIRFIKAIMEIKHKKIPEKKIILSCIFFKKKLFNKIYYSLLVIY